MEQLKPLIAEMIKLVEGGKDIVNDQLPDLCKQIVKLYLWGNVIEIPFLLTILFFGAKGAIKIVKLASADDWNEAPWLIGLVPIFALEIIVGFYAYGCIQTMLKAILAPKLLILETLKKFI